MDRIFQLNIKDAIKSKQYLASIFIVIAIVSNAIINIINNYNENNISICLYYYFLLSTCTFLLIVPIVLSIIVLAEKTSGRCEYYLANNVSINEIVNSYTKSTIVLSLIPIYLYYIIMTIYYLINNSNVIFKTILGGGSLLFNISLLIFSTMLTKFLVVLSMVSKKPDNIRSFLTIFGIVSINALILPMNYLTNKGITFDSNNIITYYVIILLGMSVICVLLIKYYNKKLCNETVILSYKE